MGKFYFYGVVTYPVKDFNEIPKGSLGIHCVEGENEQELKEKYEKEHIKKNLYLVDMFGKESKPMFKWFGKI
jgi:hypothetical protein